MLAVSVSEMEMTDNAAPRHSGQWKKGQSGNPAGMPKGTRHRATQLAEKLMDADAYAGFCYAAPTNAVSRSSHRQALLSKELGTIGSIPFKRLIRLQRGVTGARAISFAAIPFSRSSSHLWRRHLHAAAVEVPWRRASMFNPIELLGIAAIIRAFACLISSLPALLAECRKWWHCRRRRGAGPGDRDAEFLSRATQLSRQQFRSIRPKLRIDHRNGAVDAVPRRGFRKSSAETKRSVDNFRRTSSPADLAGRITPLTALIWNDLLQPPERSRRDARSCRRRLPAHSGRGGLKPSSS
jgi:hypothetical protein